ncbi:hypothetical protein [Tessaracoccus sp. MC1756]|uniref:hypothetical protein n=1 Tax=Tessaracoccus sp. MC1756 TaxID=2760311 RepID=UPI0015FEE89B|nr:hypothetical protein [Tessaracoccus sp. MC1756]MBB1510716.1 hypothetical protein [Tessaracoccus sp. MC1756]
MSSGDSLAGDDPGTVWVKLGCSAPGLYTYSYAKNIVRHGHNTLFVEQCAAVHMVGGKDKIGIRRIDQSYSRLKHHPQYGIAHVRRVIGQSTNMAERAATFGTTMLSRNPSYNDNFAFNKCVWCSSHNCSSLVWAAWMYASTDNVDLDGNKSTNMGVYPVDLVNTPLSAVNRYLERA